MVPAKTIEVIGHKPRQFDSVGEYVVSGNDLNDLYHLAERFSYHMGDPEETRDWQNRLFLMIDNARGQKIG